MRKYKIIDIDEVRSKVLSQDNAEIFKEYKRMVTGRIEENNYKGHSFHAYRYDDAVSISFISAVENDTTYIEFIKKSIMDIFNYDYIGKKGLTIYYYLNCLCFMYDMMYKFFDVDFSSSISKKILEISEYIRHDGGSEQNTSDASNWQALRFASAGLGYIVTDTDLFLSDKNIFIYDCYLKTKRYIQRAVRGGYGACEGLGYTRYAWTGIGVFGIALEKNNGLLIDDADDYDVECQFIWQFLNQVQIPFINKSGEMVVGMSPDFVDDSPNSNDSKYLGYAFYYIDESMKGGLEYIFRNYYVHGKLSTEYTSGIMFILSYRDTKVLPVSPNDIPEWRRFYDESDGLGYISFRNRYKDSEDTLISAYTKKYHTGGHEGPDSGNFRIIGLDNLWAVGGGWYVDSDEGGTPNFIRSQNTVFPYGFGGPSAPSLYKPYGQIGSLKYVDLQGEKTNGSLTIEVSPNDYDTQFLHRRILTDFEVDGVEAVCVVADTSLNGAYWQLCTNYFNNIEKLEDGFKITDPDTGHFLYGKVLKPYNRDIIIGERKRGSHYYFRDKETNVNKFVIVENKDKLDGFYPSMNREEINDYFWQSGWKDGEWVPKDFDRDFVIILCLCRSGAALPSINFSGNRIKEGMEVSIVNKKLKIDMEKISWI
jgi:hypothetical protein